LYQTRIGLKCMPIVKNRRGVRALAPVSLGFS
jgi:hypothetical protein